MSVKKYDIVIAAGGDGTINEVVNGLAGSKIKMGIIPLGTANAFAAEFDIPFDVVKACGVIIKGKTKTIDLGIAKKRYFALCAGVGFDANTIKGVKLREKKLFGSFAFVLSGIRTLHKINNVIKNMIIRSEYLMLIRDRVPTKVNAIILPMSTLMNIIEMDFCCVFSNVEMNST